MNIDPSLSRYCFDWREKDRESLRSVTIRRGNDDIAAVENAIVDSLVHARGEWTVSFRQPLTEQDALAAARAELNRV